MSRNRIIYQSETIVTAPKEFSNGATGVNVVKVTEISTNTDIARRDVNVFGKLAAIDRIILEEPKVGMDFSYYLVDGENEENVGFSIDPSTNFISGILSNAVGSERNYYILLAPEGEDANTQTSGQMTGDRYVGIGNGFLSKYMLDLKVGEPPSVSVTVEGSNIEYGSISATGTVENASIDMTQSVPTKFTTDLVLPTIDVTGNNPVSVLRPGDLVLNFGAAQLDSGGVILPGMGGNEAHVQSVSIEVPLSLKPQNRLGNTFSFSKQIDVPITVTLSATAEMTDFSEGTLVDLICAANQERDISVTMYGTCGTGDPIMVFTLKGATLDSQSMKSSIGPNKTVDLKFSAQIGGSNDQDKGLFVSGSA